MKRKRKRKKGPHTADSGYGKDFSVIRLKTNGSIALRISSMSMTKFFRISRMPFFLKDLKE